MRAQHERGIFLGRVEWKIELIAHADVVPRPPIRNGLPSHPIAVVVVWIVIRITADEEKATVTKVILVVMIVPITSTVVPSKPAASWAMNLYGLCGPYPFGR
jgi:hypothetical protein